MGATPLDGYNHIGGQHPETAALTNILAFYGVQALHTGRPISEAMLVGIGGLGAGFILWEFKEHNAKVLVLGFHSQWQYPERYLGGLCERLGIPFEFLQTGGTVAAAQHLEEALEAGDPVIAWVDPTGLPYRHLDTPLDGHRGHVVGVCGLSEAQVVVDDRAQVPLAVPAEIFSAARARIGSFKHRLLRLRPARVVDLEQAIRFAIAATVEHLSQKSDSFSLPAIRKWARMLTDTKNKKGWPTVFADHQGLFGTLRSIYEGVLPVSAGGGSLRGLYADFLEEAATVLSHPVLAEVGAQYRALATGWHAFAEAALPDTVPAFRETKDRLARRQRLFLERGLAAQPQLAALDKALADQEADLRRSFPLNASGVDDLFDDLQSRLSAIYAAEVAALEALRVALATRA